MKNLDKLYRRMLEVHKSILELPKTILRFIFEGSPALLGLICWMPEIAGGNKGAIAFHQKQRSCASFIEGDLPTRLVCSNLNTVQERREMINV